MALVVFSGAHAHTYDDIPEGRTEDGGYEEAGNEGIVEVISDVQRQQLNT